MAGIGGVRDDPISKRRPGRAIAGASVSLGAVGTLWRQQQHRHQREETSGSAAGGLPTHNRPREKHEVLVLRPINWEWKQAHRDNRLRHSSRCRARYPHIEQRRAKCGDAVTATWP